MDLKKSLLAFSLLSSGCVGFKQYTQFFYSQQANLSATEKKENKYGAEIVSGVASDVGNHRIRVGFHYQPLQDMINKREITIDPNQYQKDPSMPTDSKYLFKEEITTTTTERNSYDISLSLERVMFHIPSYQNKNLGWLQLSGLLGAGFNLNLLTGETNSTLGEYDLINLPDGEAKPFEAFVDLSLELKLGKTPVPVLPLKLGWRIFSNGKFMGAWGIGYEVQW